MPKPEPNQQPPTFQGVPLERISDLEAGHLYGEGCPDPGPRYHFLNGQIVKYAQDHGLGLIPAMQEMQKKGLI